MARRMPRKIAEDEGISTERNLNLQFALDSLRSQIPANVESNAIPVDCCRRHVFAAISCGSGGGEPCLHALRRESEHDSRWQTRCGDSAQIRGSRDQA